MFIKMLGFMIPVILSLAATTRAYREVASEAQIRFALENKYDDTGPTAQQPQYAYHTYKNLDEALVAYLDDPDTKLPEPERNRAVQKLLQPNYGEYEHKIQRYYPKTVEEYTGYNKPKQNLVLTKLNAHKKYAAPVYGFQGPLLKERETVAEPYKVKRIKPVRVKPVSVAHYSRDSELQHVQDQYNSYPKYSFSYGVNVPTTGDHKSAQETREGGAVRGYYSFLDADGVQRTVHYTADDKQGFQATVERLEHPY